MKKFILVLVFLCATSLSFAQCVGQIVGFSKGPNGEILMEASYTVDGVKEPVNDVKTYFPEQLEGKTKDQVLGKLKTDVEQRCKNIIIAKYKQHSEPPLLEYRKDKIDETITLLNKFKGDILSVSGTENSVEVFIDSDDDKTYDKKWTIKPDGTKVKEDLEAPISYSVGR